MFYLKSSFERKNTYILILDCVTITLFINLDIIQVEMYFSLSCLN